MLPPEPGVPYRICVSGKLQGPPEDCGGTPGFYNLLEAIRDPAHDQHEQMLEWGGGDFDPEAFSVDDVNQRPAPLQRRPPKG
ncbi:MAG: plasmid pRiA4b ORF-3 family protein [Acidobacteriia bacterium]|nr:plasmid pRiA4b ORF-3 family protein [Terriglobia bacterium]